MGMDPGEKRLLELGYKQELQRGLSLFSNFAFSFSVLSVLNGVTVTFGSAYGYGGPVVLVYGWLLVSAFTMIVALSMAEICSAYPTSGGLYVWAYLLAGKDHGPFWCWITGWFNALGQWAVTASVDFSLSQFVGTMITVGTGYVLSKPQTLLIYSLALVSHASVNSFEVRIVSYFETFSVAWHIIGTVVFVTVLPMLAQSHQSADFVFTHFEAYNTGLGVSSTVYRFLIGLLFAQFTFTGFDASANMSEETQGSDMSAPMGMVTAVASSVVVGFVFLISLLFSIQNPHTLLDLGNQTGGYGCAQIVYDVMYAKFHSKWSVLAMLAILAVAIWLCGLSCLASNSRMVYAFSRGGALPLSSVWQTVLPHSKVPIYAVWLSATIALAFGLPYLQSLEAFTALVSIATIGLFISYALPIFLRLTIARNTFKSGPFNLGVWSIPCGVMSVGWVIFISIIFCFPVIFPVTLDNFNYAPLAVSVTLFGSLFAWISHARMWFTGPAGDKHVIPLLADVDILA